ncbi:MAG: hypothetical protein QOF69_3214 [Solirubrobacteraceae bacterium]|nr:hypothetical protein [Solirubrobacteraceae bacterium]
MLGGGGSRAAAPRLQYAAASRRPDNRLRHGARTSNAEAMASISTAPGAVPATTRRCDACFQASGSRSTTTSASIAPPASANGTGRRPWICSTASQARSAPGTCGTFVRTAFPSLRAAPVAGGLHRRRSRGALGHVLDRDRLDDERAKTSLAGGEGATDRNTLKGAGATGLEPATSGVTGRRSNQLSYAPSGDDQYANTRTSGAQPLLRS